MPPPKAKLHKNTGKSRPAPPQITQSNLNNSEIQPSTSSGTTTTTLTSEQEQQAELYWCIQQLQTALSSNKLNNKQMQDHTKALNTLMSNTAPMIKKRQVMRLSFGDYREKIAAEEKKTKKISMKVVSAKPSQKSVFIKKAIITSSQNSFRFNFPSSENQDVSSPNTETNGYSEKVKHEDIDNSKNPVFVRSNNSFKFNFSTDES